MRVAIIGGGPAGLFCASLIKRQSMRHEVTVFERNTLETTYGWGIVLSDRSVRLL